MSALLEGFVGGIAGGLVALTAVLAGVVAAGRWVKRRGKASMGG